MANNNYIELLKHQALQDMLNRMRDEDKRTLVMLNNNESMMKKLDSIEEKVARKKYSFGSDLLANVAGNAIFDGGVYLISQLFKRIKP